MANGDEHRDSSGPVRPPAEPRSFESEPETLKLLAEEFSVETERVETGRVRLRVATHEHEETVDVPLTEQRVEVQRVPIGREVDTIPPRRQEGDITIVPVVEEVIVLSRKLVLKEEVHLKLVQSVEQYRERVILHRQEAIVEHIPTNQASVRHESG